MFCSTLLTLSVVPVLYMVLDDPPEWVKKRGPRRSRALPACAEQALS